MTADGESSAAEILFGDGVPSGACAVCPHGNDSHDAIASRYCAATASGGLHRRCACSSETLATTRKARKEDRIMPDEITYVSRYDQRIASVRAVLEEDTGLTGAACQALAVRLLRLIDEAPEKLRR